jgi:predicted ATPase
VLTQLAREPRARFELLVSRQRPASPRHRTLWTAIDWSYQLLPAELQQFFLRLSVFRGGWTLTSAEAIAGCATQRVPGVADCGLGADERPAINDQIRSGQSAIRHPPSAIGQPAISTIEAQDELRAASLVLGEEAMASGAAPELRLRMLETLREYGWARLAPAARAELQARHARYFLEMAEDAARRHRGPGGSEWLDRLEQEQANLRATLDWFLTGPETVAAPGPAPGSEGPDREGALRLCVALAPFWQLRGGIAEGRLRLEAALSGVGTAPRSLRARALCAAGSLARSERDAVAAGDLCGSRSCRTGTRWTTWTVASPRSGEPWGPLTSASPGKPVARSPSNRPLTWAWNRRGSKRNQPA